VVLGDQEDPTIIHNQRRLGNTFIPTVIQKTRRSYAALYITTALFYSLNSFQINILRLTNGPTSPVSPFSPDVPGKP